MSFISRNLTHLFHLKGLVMQALMKSLLLTLVLSASISSVYADSFNGLEVIGQASIDATPDVFIVKLTIKDRGVTAHKTKALVDQKTKQVTKGLLSLGVDKRDIQTSKLMMNTVYHKEDVQIHDAEIIKNINQQKVKVNTKVEQHGLGNKNYSHKSYVEVSRYIHVKLKDISIYDRILDDSVRRGVSHISPVEMSFTNQEIFYEQALVQAIDNAQRKASNMAKQVNKVLGDVIEVQELSHFMSPSRISASALSFSSEYLVGTQAIKAKVKVRFNLDIP